MILSHKIALNTNKTQEELLSKAAGCARFTFNWGLARWNEMYKAWKGDNTLPKPTANIIKKEFNKIKEVEFPWIYESPKDANQQAFAFLNTAFTRFFNKLGKYPQFKKKNKSRDSFYMSNDKFWIDEYIIKLPVIGEVKLTEKLRFNGKIMSATVSRHANRWFVSINVDVLDYKKENIFKDGIIGIDLGLTSFATLSDGTKFQAPKPLKKHSRKMKRLQRQHSRKQKGSKNKEKSRRRIARLHKKIHDIRNDFSHKLSTSICDETQVIVLEDLKVSNMIKNHKLAKAISDVGWGEFRRQMEYKAPIFGSIIILADTYFASSKTCSSCGCVDQKLDLSDRTYECKNCGLIIDRDINAAINLHTLGLREIYACGHMDLCSPLDKREDTSTMVEARSKEGVSGYTFTHNL